MPDVATLKVPESDLYIGLTAGPFVDAINDCDAMVCAVPTITDKSDQLVAPVKSDWYHTEAE
jgi:hypothetical protein